MEITFRSENTLLVDGKLMEARLDGSDKLLKVLTMGREAIINTIDMMYIKYHLDNLDYQARTGKVTLPVQRGSVFVMELCLGDTALSDEGLFSALDKHINRGVFEEQNELKPDYFTYWQAIKKSELIPIARQVKFEKKDRIWLAVRDTPLRVFR